MIRKFFFAFMAALALSVLFCAAQAAGQVNPRWREVREAETQWQTRREAPRTRGVNVTLECVSEPTLDEPLDFRAVISGGDPADYVAVFSVHDEVRDPYGFLYFGDATTDLAFDFVRLYSTGEYTVAVNLYRADDTDMCVSFDSYSFTLTGPETASLEYKVSQIVAQCRGADDWHTALNLHDWLTHNAYYDLKYEYYGPDIMLRGCGVCDSYSKAYKMLCLAAGITNDRMTSDAMWHAWNAIKLGGEWYQVDVTWDDPSGAAVPLSGLENYEYFCLNDDMMFTDHASSDLSFDPGCFSLEANYAIHEGLWQRYGMILNENDDGIHSIILDYAEAIDEGQTEVTLEWTSYWEIDPKGVYWSYYAGDKVHYLFAYGMTTLEWTFCGAPVEVTAVHLPGTDGVTLTVVGEISYPIAGSWGQLAWTLEEDGSLYISGTGGMDGFKKNSKEAWKPFANAITSVTVERGVTSVGERAFEGCASLTGAYISRGVSEIGGLAFAGCGSLENVTIPGSVSRIGANAFDRCGGLAFVYFNGTIEEWELVGIGSGNACLTGAILVCYPSYDASVTIFLPADLGYIESEAFAGSAANAVVIPQGVSGVAGDAFDGSLITVVYGFEGSAAEAFAADRPDMLFIPIDGAWLEAHR